MNRIKELDDAIKTNEDLVVLLEERNEIDKELARKLEWALLINALAIIAILGYVYL